MFLIRKNKWLQIKRPPHKFVGEPLLGTTDNSSAIVWICVWCVCLESGWVKGLLMTGWGSFLPWTNDCQCWDNAVAATTPHNKFHIAVTAFGQDRRFNLGMREYFCKVLKAMDTEWKENIQWKEKHCGMKCSAFNFCLLWHLLQSKHKKNRKLWRTKAKVRGFQNNCVGLCCEFCSLNCLSLYLNMS